MGVDPVVIPQLTGVDEGALDAFAREMQAFAMGVFEEISHEREDSIALHGSVEVPADIADAAAAGTGEAFTREGHVHNLPKALVLQRIEEEGIVVDDGEIDGIDLSVVDDGVEDITAAEWTQLANIDDVTVSNAQWGYLGALDQMLDTDETPVFKGLHLLHERVAANDAEFFFKDAYTDMTSDPKWGFLGWNDAGLVYLNSGSAVTANLHLNRFVERPVLIGKEYSENSGIRFNETTLGPLLWGVSRTEMRCNDNFSVAGTLRVGNGYSAASAIRFGDMAAGPYFYGYSASVIRTPNTLVMEGELFVDQIRGTILASTVSIAAVTIVDGEVDGIDLGNVDDGVEDISETQWGYLAALDQGLAVASSPAFVDIGLTGVLKTADGSAADPAWTFTGDPDTGFYRSGNGSITAVSNTTAILTIDGTGIFTGGIGNVGSLKIGGTEVIDSARNADFVSYKAGGAAGIDASIAVSKNGGGYYDLAFTKGLLTSLTVN